MVFCCLGSNATVSFEDVGHSSDARKMQQDYYIGDLHPVSNYYYAVAKTTLCIKLFPCCLQACSFLLSIKLVYFVLALEL